jgi:hypothetical protein
MKQRLVTKQNNVSKTLSFYLKLNCFEILFCFGQSLSLSDLCDLEFIHSYVKLGILLFDRDDATSDHPDYLG